jgi:hypothetical protein
MTSVQFSHQNLGLQDAASPSFGILRRASQTSTPTPISPKITDHFVANQITLTTTPMATPPGHP